MAPKRDKRPFNLAASLCPPRMTKPDTLTEHIQSAKHEEYIKVEEYIHHEEYSGDEEYTQYEEYTGTQHEEYAQREEYTQDDEQNENYRHEPSNDDDDEESVFKGAYGWYTIGADDEREIERGLLTPQAVPMVKKHKVLTCTRAEALEMYQPIAEKFEASYATADVRREVRNNVTKELVKVLPPYEKKLLKGNAELHGVVDVLERFYDVDLEEDLQEFRWKETYEVPRLTPRQINDTWEDLHHLAHHSHLYLASREELRITVLKMLFDEQTKRIKELEEELDLRNAAVEPGVGEAAGEGLETPRKSAKHGMKFLVKGFVKRAFCYRR